MLKRLELFEHQTVRVGESLLAVDGTHTEVSERELEALNRFNDLHGGRFFQIGHRRFTTTQYVGYVEVGRLAIEILPKADRGVSRLNPRPWREGLMEMLRVATGLPLKSPAPASQKSVPSTILELVALRFVEEVGRLLHEGLAKGYRDTESNGPTFRGRLVFAEHLRMNLVRADRFHVRHATFDRDVVVNRILRQALGALTWVALSPLLSARAAALCDAFPETSSIGIRPDLFERMRLSRSTSRYQDALVLARMILESRAPQLRAGATRVFALLFDMNTLWELYVATLFRRVAPAHLEVSVQENRPFWQVPGRLRRTVRPDLVVRNRTDKKVLLVADTKWKSLPDGNPSDGDLRQMYVYNELFGAPESLLVYPAVDNATARTGTYVGRGCGFRTIVNAKIGSS